MSNIERIDSLEKYKKFINGEKKNIKILVHACCAPCSSEVLNELSKVCDITIYYYNPNTFPHEEYDAEEFLDYIGDVKGLKEGSSRCYKCYDLRLEKTAKKAKELGYDYFTTTLSISPYKNSNWINEIGLKYSEVYNVEFLYSNFKKNDGYKKSIILSKEFNLYRQEYCGCRFSLEELKEKEMSKKE